MHKLATLALAFSVMTVLSACSSSIGQVFDTQQNVGPCPSSASIYEASRIVEFKGEDLTYDNITYTGEIVGVRLYCRYVNDDPLLAEIELDFAFGKGPLADEQRHTYQYFIAATRRNSRVLEKQSFSIEADFKDGPVVGIREFVGRIVIPRADETISGANFEILVGFDLTPEQLEFNRAGKRFRLDAGASVE